MKYYMFVWVVDLGCNKNSCREKVLFSILKCLLSCKSLLPQVPHKCLDLWEGISPFVIHLPIYAFLNSWVHRNCVFAEPFNHLFWHEMTGQWQNLCHWKFLFEWFGPYLEVGSKLVTNKDVPTTTMVSISCCTNAAIRVNFWEIILGIVETFLQC